MNANQFAILDLEELIEPVSPRFVERVYQGSFPMAEIKHTKNNACVGIGNPPPELYRLFELIQSIFAKKWLCCVLKDLRASCGLYAVLPPWTGRADWDIFSIACLDS